MSRLCSKRSTANMSLLIFFYFYFLVLSILWIPESSTFFDFKSIKGPKSPKITHNAADRIFPFMPQTQLSHQMNDCKSRSSPAVSVSFQSELGKPVRGRNKSGHTTLNRCHLAVSSTWPPADLDCIHIILQILRLVLKKLQGHTSVGKLRTNLI